MRTPTPRESRDAAKNKTRRGSSKEKASDPKIERLHDQPRNPAENGGERSKSGFGNLDNLVESGGIGDRHVGEHLAVKNNVRLFKTVDKLTVANASHANGGVNTNNPEATKISFPSAAVARREHVGAKNGLFYGAQKLAPTSAKSLGALKQPILSATTSGAFCNSHSNNPSTNKFYRARRPDRSERSRLDATSNENQVLRRSLAKR